jgi:hypothetical protein
MLQFVLGFILWIDVCFCYSALQIKKNIQDSPTLTDWFVFL